jgi:hypothetical protein
MEGLCFGDRGNIVIFEMIVSGVAELTIGMIHFSFHFTIPPSFFSKE